MKIGIFLLTFIIGNIAWCQDDYTNSILDSWKSYKTAYIEKDYTKVVGMTNPMVVEKTGGETYFVNDMLHDQGMLESQGIILSDMKAKQASAVLKSKVEWQTILPYERILKVEGQEIIQEHFMLVTSQDDGKTWWFFDLSKQDEESIKIYLPHFDDRLSVYLEK